MSLWDSSEEENAVGRSTNGIIGQQQKEGGDALSRSKLHGKKSNNSLFDSDNESYGEDDLSSLKNRSNHCVNLPVQNSILPTSKSNGALSDDSSASSGDVNYKERYIAEKKRRKACEVVIESLHNEIFELREKLSKLSGISAVLSTDEHVVGQLSKENGPTLSSRECPSNNDWEQLAQQEKQRRQMKLRKIGRNTNSSRLLTKVDTNTVKPLLKSEEGHISIEQNESKSVPVIQPIDISEVKDESDVRVRTVGAEHNCEGKEPDHIPTSIVDSDISSVLIEPKQDPSSATWQELAAMEKQRRAQARRSVRPCRAPAHGSATSHADAPITRAYRPLHQSVSTASSSVEHTSIPPKAHMHKDTSNTVHNITDNSKVNYDSRWTSSDSESDNNSQWSDNDAENTAVTGGHSNLALEPKEADKVGFTELTVESQHTIEMHLRQWAAGKDVAALLMSLGNIAEINDQISNPYQCTVSHALRIVFADGSVRQAIIDLWNSNRDIKSIRRTYLKVIRYCHPDKNAAIPRESLEYFELQQIFTILSDAYNRMK